MPLAPEFRAAVERTLPPAALIREPEQLRTYECDALTGHRAVPELVVIPDSAAQVQAVVPPLPRASRPVRRPRRGHRALRRRPARRRRRRHRAHAPQPRARGRPRARPGGGRAGRHEPRHHPCGRRRRLLLRPRPVEPAGLHDRRQRRRELGRRPLPQARLHRQPRPRRRRRPPGRRARDAVARRRGPRPARRVRRLGGDARDRGPRDRRASCACPRRCERCSPASSRSRRPAMPSPT